MSQEEKEKQFRKHNIEEAMAIKALVTQAERLYPMSKRLDAKIEELEKYLETHNQHVTHRNNAQFSLQIVRTGKFFMSSIFIP